MSTVEKIIDKISEAVNLIYDPNGIKSGNRKFNEELAIHTAQLDGFTPAQKGELMQEYYLLLAKNKNRKNIIGKSIPYIESSADPHCLDDSWIFSFWDKSGGVSDSDLQELWGRVLAQEINKPNTISKRLLNNLSLMSPVDAINFSNIARFCFDDCKYDMQHPIIFVKEHSKAYADSNITTKVLNELEHFSLIEIDYSNGFCFEEWKILRYMQHTLDIRGKKIKCGNVRLTDDGQQLIKIVSCIKNKQIFEYTLDTLQNYGYEISIS